MCINFVIRSSVYVFFNFDLGAGNQITEINGLKELSRLAHFSIADNRVEAISNLDDLTIKFLRLVSR